MIPNEKFTLCLYKYKYTYIFRNKLICFFLLPFLLGSCVTLPGGMATEISDLIRLYVYHQEVMMDTATYVL